MKKQFLLSIMLIFAMIGGSFAQERTIKGTVTSAEDGSLLPGVNVIVKGTSIGTITDARGHIQLMFNLVVKLLCFPLSECKLRK